jgi:thymidylate kinase
MTHERWVSEGKPDNAVHETTRTAYQSIYLRRHGWKVVLLKVDPDLQLERAKKLGVTAEEIEKWSRHPVDSGLPEMCADWVVDGSWPIEYVAKEILARASQSSIAA